MNKKSRFKVVSCILSVCIILSSVSFALFSVSATETNATTKFTILHTNDIHGNAVASDSYPNAISYARIATMKKALKSEGLDPILVDSGDYIQGTPFASMSQGANIITLMNKVGYDVSTLGNHEFEFGTEKLLEIYSKAEFRNIAANVINKNTGEPLLKGVGVNQADNNGANYIIERNGHKIGFFGIDTTETGVKTNPNNVKTVSFEDETKTAEAQVKALQDQGAEMIVALVHMGCKDESISPSAALAKNVSGIDLILDGHSHETYKLTYQNPEGKDVIVMQENIGGANIGRIDVTFNEDGSKTLDAHTLALSANEKKGIEALPEYAQDSEISALYDELSKSSNEWVNKVVAFLDGTLFGRSYSESSCQEMGKAFETNLGDLAADADAWKMSEEINKTAEYKKYADMPIVSIENGGGMRAGASGLITNGELYTIFPFPNGISAIEITPKLLYDALECGVSKPQLAEDEEEGVNILSGIDGGFPQVGGMAFEWDVTATARTKGQPFSGDRVKTIWLLDENGNKKTKLDKNDNTTKILLACNEYLASGGNDYETLASLSSVITISGTEDGLAGQFGALLDYVKAIQTEAGAKFLSMPAQQGRITLLNTDTLFKEYTAFFILSYNGEELANTEISVSIDNNAGIQTMKTDANGILDIKGLSAGNHEFRLSYTNADGDNVGTQAISDNTVSDMLIGYKIDFAKVGYNATKVDNVISQIPTNVTKADADIVSVARQAYDALIKSEKAKVTNYQKLLDAEAIISGGGKANGWQQTDGKWQYIKNGEALKDWHNDIPGWEGQWFFFDRTTGYANSAWANNIPGWDGQWFYFNPNTCVMMKNWVNDGGTRFFYLDDNTGVMKTGWQFLNWSGGANWFYFDNNGSMQTGWIFLNNKWYFLGSNGAMVTGKQTIDGTYYIFNDKGELLGE